jgi:hypothetical protein
MTDQHSLERRVADHFAAEAPTRAPDWVLGEVLTSIETTRQRRSLVRVPWRFQIMTNFAKTAIAALAVVVIGGLGALFLRPGSGPGVGSPGPSATAGFTVPFTSRIHGYEISLPDSWRTRPATAAWPAGEVIADGDAPYIDEFLSSTGFGPMYVTSQTRVAGSGTTPVAWFSEQRDYTALWGGASSCDNSGAPTTTEPVAIDGGDAILDTTCPTIGYRAFAVAGGRGYVFMLRGDQPDKAWFISLLATVRLHPELAADTSTTPAP